MKPQVCVRVLAAYPKIGAAVAYTLPQEIRGMSLAELLRLSSPLGAFRVLAQPFLAFSIVN